ncbi:hypothetical protein PE067_05205 [Paracoccus sp. DMF-8]|uniref:hypothetical protein n=1 Tax=Paracoccus sp. DMF-8 TaxID=3019445 RepID=UPI0023E8BB7F|nr:hypothetical protein [Paracoccus sp. DMF-8]MDF3605595.1 hypothetical protein [Paracoccus sp. DMF-8]
MANEPVAAASSPAEPQSASAAPSPSKPAAGADDSCGAGCAARSLGARNLGDDPARLNTGNGTAQSGGAFKIGARVDPQELHVVTRPGLYGMGHPPRGNSYGVVNGRLIRFDPDTMQLLSVIRDVDQILD